jgi:eukaryotic-like serine/threonine-protein kinase
MQDAPGRILTGKYELLERAGAGGMAVVWRGRTLGASGFTRLVAIKRIISHLARSEEFVRMFVEESRVVSELAHPGIAQIHDFDQDEEGHHFLVLEWVEGIDLAELVAAFATAGERAPWPLVCQVGIGVLEALSAAHDRRNAALEPTPIYHRDLTPQNIRITTLGYVKLTDFGVAKAADRVSFTRPDAIKGKLSYLAPESVRGAPASARTDLYSVAIVLWEALAGRRLYDGRSDAEVMFQVHDGRVPSLRSIRSDIPDSLESVMSCALSRDANGRFETVRAFARALTHVLSEDPNPMSPRRLAELVAWVRGERPTLEVPAPSIPPPPER